MLAFSMLNWWYLQGWGIFLGKIKTSFRNTADFFSFDTLVKTLFAPFRQISAGNSGAISLDAKMRAALDKLFSRIIGFIVRFFLLLVGGIAIIIQAVLALVMLIVWPLMPILPVIGIVLMIIGVGA